MTASDRSAARAAPLTTAAIANSAAKDLRLGSRRFIEISVRKCTTSGTAQSPRIRLRFQRSAKLKRFVALLAARTDELERLEAEGGFANAKHLHRARIDQLTIAFEQHAVAVVSGARVRLVAGVELAPDTLERRTDVGLHAWRVLEVRIEDGFHVRAPWSACGHAACDSAVMVTLSRGLLAGIRSFRGGPALMLDRPLGPGSGPSASKRCVSH